MLIIEDRRRRGEPVGQFHRKRLSAWTRLMRREHQSFQFRGHFPQFDTQSTSQFIGGSRLRPPRRDPAGHRIRTDRCGVLGQSAGLINLLRSERGVRAAHVSLVVHVTRPQSWLRSRGIGGCCQVGSRSPPTRRSIAIWSVSPPRTGLALCPGPSSRWW